ncbi:MAG: nucleotide-binding protein [Polyangiaceae bacterium]|nr:nucleotide-binding protein [Polyangiaceae bacterium]MCW5789024.1 nucleotide-binding protein [Polyangiaceae bacterium]
MKPVHLLVPAVALAAVVGFWLKPDSAEESPRSTAARAEALPTEAPLVEPGALPAGHPPVGQSPGQAPLAPAHPQAPATHGAPGASGLAGVVLERLEVAEYTYLRLQTPSGEVWAAVKKAPVSVGQSVTIPSTTLMEDFDSPTLGRRFERIYFGVLGDVGPAGSAAAAQGQPPAAAGAPAAASATAPRAPGPYAPAPVGSVLSRAPGSAGVLLAELAGDAARYHGKTVRIHVEVTKLTTGIFGKSFLHVKDGSTSGGRVVDLAVTTTLEPQVGTQLVLEGVFKTDVDFGSGYRYPMLLEDAKAVP